MSEKSKAILQKVRCESLCIALAVKNIEINFMFLARLVVSLQHKCMNYGKV